MGYLLNSGAVSRTRQLIASGLLNITEPIHLIQFRDFESQIRTQPYIPSSIAGIWSTQNIYAEVVPYLGTIEDIVKSAAYRIPELSGKGGECSEVPERDIWGWREHLFPSRT